MIPTNQLFNMAVQSVNINTHSVVDSSPKVDSREKRVLSELETWGGIDVIMSQARLRIKFESAFTYAFNSPTNYTTDDIQKCLAVEVTKFPTDHFLKSLQPLLVK